ncbi:unnamed protein product [Haemonchus placei]|uniref:VWFA domain-containing protein n=1 Tax=Haemonchus placei TaxID=6290 RepID=A0A158QQS2_HAEPC|nr:unnamed protein product [Haemonchus placei]
MVNASDEEVNDPNSKDFIRFMSAKQGNDATTIYVHDHSLRRTKVNETRNFTLSANANFYNLATSSIASALVTSSYSDPELLRKIEWSQIDEVYRTHREETRDLAFQLFCSESGYMRFFPAASWFWDNHIEHLDLFDCRNTQWYINAATNSKNVLIMLDMSGSMLGQRYEIAKQTTEAILETLSHNDYFNIMPFSKTPFFLDDCNGRNGLLQATMRNKKLLRNKMNNVSSEGKAEYEKALPHAFTTLLNLPGHYELHTREEMAVMEPNATRDRIHVVFPEHVLSADPEYIEAISSRHGRPDQGCENVIMLITDGAPNVYKEIFDLYNKDKKVRFFSFLIGEEAIDFEQVKTMACTNRGYMVHVQNMADVEDKVQHYIRTMSRPIGQHAGDIQVDDALWSGVYRERLVRAYVKLLFLKISFTYVFLSSCPFSHQSSLNHKIYSIDEIFAEPVPITNQSYAIMNKMAARRVSSEISIRSSGAHTISEVITFQKIRLQKTEARGRMFVTTVSFPVIVNRTFMGVAAVNTPLTELNQQAHPSNIGGRSYFFMLDQNGFIMFHPQLRPIDPATKSHKQNYNNMDLLELEVPQSQQVDFFDSFVPSIWLRTIMYYKQDSLGITPVQVRSMVMNCDNSDPQLLDVLYATEALDRVYPQTNVYYSECIKGANFVLGLAMAKGDDYRWRPKSRSYDYSHVQISWMNDKRWRVHPHWRYCLLNDTDTNVTKEEAFVIYANQMRQSGKIPYAHDALLQISFWFRQIASVMRPSNLIHLVFFTAPSGLIRFYNQTLDDYDYEDPNWSIFDHIGAILSIEHVQDRLSPPTALYIRFSLLVAIEKDVVLVETKSAISNCFSYCAGNVSMKPKLFFLDLSVFRSYNHFITDLNRKSVDDTYYRRSVRMKDHIVFDVSNKCIRLNQIRLAKIWYKSETQLTGYGLNENLTMLAQGTKAIYLGNALLGSSLTFCVAGFEFAYDYVVNLMGEHGCGPSPFYMLYHWFMSSIYQLLLLAKQYPLLHLFHSFVKPVESYTASFHEGSDGFPCSKHSYFYLSNRDGRSRPQSTSLVDMNRSDRPCTLNSAKCSVKMQAAFVEGTNLVMVWIIQDKTSDNCYDDTQCPKVEPSEVPFGFERVPPLDPSEKCTGVPHRKPARSKSMCYNTVNEVSYTT